MFNNIPTVTKNLLIINILVYLFSFVIIQQNLPIDLGAHYVNSVLFKPYQIVTHMFAHSNTDFLHIFFNMFLLVSFGSHLERIWGPKRYFIFYIACGLGAFALYNAIGVYQLHELKQSLITLGVNIDSVNYGISNNDFSNISVPSQHFKEANEVITNYILMNVSSIVGASGAIFGLLAGFALLFPNTELMLLFPPIPIKAKYLIGGYILFEIYNSIYRTNDHIAHLAHVGGAIVGIIIILYWRRTDKSNFY